MIASIRARAGHLLRSRASLLAAFALAAVHLVLALRFANEPLFAKYPALAARLRAGTLTAAQVSDASPGYLLLHLALAPGTIRALQLLASAATVFLVARVGARLAGPALGLAAAAALALAGPWLLYPSVLEPDLLIGALNLAAATALLLPERRSRRAAALAGVLLGLSIALRPTAALFGLAALGWLVLTDRRAAERRPLARALAFGTALLLAAAGPIAALRLHAGGAFERGSSMSAGAVAHLGHRPEGTGLGGNYPTLLKLVELQSLAGADRTPDHAHELYRVFASAAEGRPLAAPEAERYWLAKVAAFAREAPGAFVAQLGRKLVFAIAAPPDDHDIPDVQRAALESPVPSLSLRWLALAGAGGLLASLVARGAARRRCEPAERSPRAATTLLAGWIAAYVTAFLVFYYQSRYAPAIMPAWALLAAAGAAALREVRRDRARLLAGVALAAVPLGLLLLPFVRHEARFQERRLLVPIRSEAVALRREGRWSAALDRFLDEQAALPDFVWPWSPHGFGLDADSPDHALGAADRARRRFGTDDPVDAYLLAVLYAHGGRCDAALPLLDQASRAGVFGAVADRALDPDLLASDCLAELDRSSEAFERLRRALARRPGTLDGLTRAIAATAALPALDERRERAGWERQLAALHDPASVRFALSGAYLRWGKPARALAEADALRGLLPAAAPFAEFERGRALLALGRTNDALRAYARALELRHPMHGAIAFDAAIRALEAAAPDDPAARAVALAHWMRRGNHEAVRSLVRRDPALANRARALGEDAGEDSQVAERAGRR
jgi:4-amino-4-deoxy-L-arabinose transferase-like glycosyltransferase